VDLEERLELLGPLGEAMQVLLELRRLAELLAEQHLVVDQLHGGGGVGLQGGVALEIGLGEDALALLPALAPVGTQRLDELGRRQLLGHVD
jgi:hypothetical protein